MLRQPNHGAEAALETRIVQAELVGFVRAADILDIENRLAWKAGVERKEYLGDIPIEIFDM